MKRTINASQLLGFSVASFAGTILHFLYDWLGQSPYVAPFSGVNESTFEHMKLLFWPTFCSRSGRAFSFVKRSFGASKCAAFCTDFSSFPSCFTPISGRSQSPLIGSILRSFSSRRPCFTCGKHGNFTVKRPPVDTLKLRLLPSAFLPFCSHYSPFSHQKSVCSAIR